MKRLLTSVVLASAMFSSGAIAQSAKFTAVYKDDINPTFVRSEACAATTDFTYCDDLGISVNSMSTEVAAGFAKIRIPQSKELLVGLSAQVALFTETVVKGKRGSYSRSLASAEGAVTLYACLDGSWDSCYKAAPGEVTLNKREQELEAVLAGVIESCDVEVVVDPDTGLGSGEFSLSDCDVLDEMIGLSINTMSAHHFNFVFPNLPQGDYQIIAKFMTSAAAEAESYCYYYEGGDLGCDDDVDGEAGGHAYAYIGKYMMSVQSVRAVKDEGGDPDGEPLVID